MARLDSPAAERNKEPIAEVLGKLLPAEARVLEVASGSGQHASHFAKRFPNWTVQPSDPREEAREGIAAWRTEEALPNLLAPLAIDVLTPRWWEVAPPTDAVVCFNMIHIAPVEATAGLLRGAAALLSPDTPCVLYGPFRFDGRFLAESNAAFDASLRQRDPSWGVRDLADVTATAEAEGFTRDEVIAMPANNHVVVFRRLAASAQKSAPPKA